jgi:hypothetical protein
MSNSKNKRQEVMQLCGASGVGFSGGSIAWSERGEPGVRASKVASPDKAKSEGRNVRFVES